MPAKNQKKPAVKRQKQEAEDMWSRKSDFIIGPADYSKIFYITSIVILILVSVGLILSLFFVKNELSTTKKESGETKETLDATKKDLEKRLLPLEQKAEQEIKNLEAQKAKAEQEKNSKGFIEGSLSYPSNYIPKTIKVCAQNSETEEQVCTENQIVDKKYSYGIGYKLEVKTGKYTVFATDPSWGDYQAYYSDYVVCGLNYTCPSHNPIEIEVKAGTTTDKVDPVDWYNKK